VTPRDITDCLARAVTLGDARAFSPADQLRRGPAPANASPRQTGSGTCLCSLLCREQKCQSFWIRTRQHIRSINAFESTRGFDGRSRCNKFTLPLSEMGQRPACRTRHRWSRRQPVFLRERTHSPWRPPWPWRANYGSRSVVGYNPEQAEILVNSVSYIAPAGSLSFWRTLRS
jgi:hypothetical protein